MSSLWLELSFGRCRSFPLARACRGSTLMRQSTISCYMWRVRVRLMRHRSFPATYVCRVRLMRLSTPFWPLSGPSCETVNAGSLVLVLMIEAVVCLADSSLSTVALIATIVDSSTSCLRVRLFVAVQTAFQGV